MDAQEIQFPALTPTSDDDGSTSDVDGSTSVAVWSHLKYWIRK